MRRLTTPTIHTFTYFGMEFRGFLIEGEPHFFGMDPCKVLEIKSPHVAYARLRPEQKSNRSRTAVGLPPGRDIVIINESGLFDLIFRSDKPEALNFRAWVTDVVLPTLRKTGSYILGEERVASGN